ncbi:unnamed protein product [Adineta ricciae]|uniref:G-protein coupled receptors family 1 profile domain-containing protein n=1 Tax=Adineta ricciae TaxID=249248 RepID=A0A814Z6S8_ADIRI|nr:unnamed protein product [Adineta ricciae]CAF1299876.1 unnamed protein product [Adineta ricciae]
MSSSSIDADIATILNNATNQINRYISLVVFIFGIIGNILNIFVFLHRTLRSNSCSLLFLTASIGNIITIISGLITRMLSGWSADLTNTIDWLCKLRIVVLWTSRTFVMWILMLTTIDRWLSSSIHVHYRQKTTLKNAYRGIFLVLLFSIILNIDLLYCYQANLLNTPLKCYSKTEICRLITDFTYALIIYTIPLISMTLFGLAIIKTIRQMHHRRVQPIVTTETPNGLQTVNIPIDNLKQKKKIDRRLLRMHLIQVFILCTLNLPAAIQRLYSTLTINNDKSLIQLSIENLLFNVVIHLNYISSGITFYIFTLYGGKLFRNAFWDLMKNILFIK